MYAHKLATLIGESVKKEPSQNEQRDYNWLTLSEFLAYFFLELPIRQSQIQLYCKFNANSCFPKFPTDIELKFNQFFGDLFERCIHPFLYLVLAWLCWFRQSQIESTTPSKLAHLNLFKTCIYFTKQIIIFIAEKLFVH